MSQAREASSGKVFLVGAGPGHPGLITVRGSELLGRADLVVYDGLVDARLLRLAPASAERLRAERDDDGIRVLVERARAGKCVVRLTGGDPLVSGEVAAIGEALVDAGVSFEIVPGVPHEMAAMAYAGLVPSATGSDPGGELYAGPRVEAIDFGGIASARSSVTMNLDVERLNEIARKLIEAGRSAETPVALVANPTLATQQVMVGRLEEIAGKAQEARLTGTAVMVLGEAVRQREGFAWFERLPLFGQAIVVTRARSQAGEMTSMLEALGAEVIEMPTIEIAPPESYTQLDEAIARLERYDWLVLTSVNGVAHFLRRLDACGRDARALANVRIAAVGTATAEALRQAHLRADAIPPQYNAETLVKLLAAEGVAGKRILIVRAVEGAEVLPVELRRQGAEVDLVPAYRNVRPELDVAPLRERLEAGTVSAITFASSSAVRNFAERFEPGELPRLLEKTRVAVIGPMTAITVEELGLKVSIQPRESTIAALVDALVEALGPSSAMR